MGAVPLVTNAPHSARIYDYLLGGKDNFPADRDAAEQIRAHLPGLPISMRANRDYMVRAVRYLAGRGIRQFLDVGAGLPRSPNLHEAAQQIAPGCRVVYVDNDPIVISHARARMHGTAEGMITCLDGDLNDPAAILDAPATRRTLDPRRPVAVTLIAILQFIADETRVGEIISRLMAPLCPGSALAISTVTAGVRPRQSQRAIAACRTRGIPIKARDRGEVTRLFDDLALVDPGVVPVHRWRPDGGAGDVDDNDVFMYGGVAVKA